MANGGPSAAQSAQDTVTGAPRCLSRGSDGRSSRCLAHFIVLSANLNFVTKVRRICFVDFANLRAESWRCRLQGSVQGFGKPGEGGV